MDFGDIDNRVIAVTHTPPREGVKSELRDEWEESDGWHEWQQAVEGLRRRLQG